MNKATINFRQDKAALEEAALAYKMALRTELRHFSQTMTKVAGGLFLASLGGVGCLIIHQNKKTQHHGLLKSPTNNIPLSGHTISMEKRPRSRNGWKKGIIIALIVWVIYKVVSMLQFGSARNSQVNI